MNTIPPSDHSSYPSLQPAWHKMIHRSRASERAIALQLCRAAFLARNGGHFPGLGTCSDTAIAAELGLTLRQAQRLREDAPLWRWQGDDLKLFFVDAPAGNGQPTPETYGKRRARHAVAAAERRQRAAGRRRLLPPPGEYPMPNDDNILLAAEEDDLGSTDT